MNVYKIGSGYYTSGDKNSGMFEFDKINQVLSDYDRGDVVVVVNGKPDEQSKIDVSKMLADKKKIVFIMSDLISFSTCKEIIENAALVLHQSPIKLNINNEHQTYGYVPELFADQKPVNSRKTARIVFGGSNADREDKFVNYLYESGIDSNSELIVYRDWIDTYSRIYKDGDYTKDTVKDNRLNYNEFIERLARHHASIVFSKKEYREIGWITSRVFECARVNTFPIFDYEYDCFDELKYPFEKVHDYHSMISTNFQTILQERATVRQYIDQLLYRAEFGKKLFRELVFNV